MALEIRSNTMYMYACRLYRSWSKCTESIISGLNAILDRENLAERKLGTDRAKFTQNETNTTPAKRATELFEGKSITHCLASIELDHSSHVTSYWQWCCCDDTLRKQTCTVTCMLSFSPSEAVKVRESEAVTFRWFGRRRWRIRHVGWLGHQRSAETQG